MIDYIAFEVRVYNTKLRIEQLQDAFVDAVYDHVDDIEVEPLESTPEKE